MLKVLLTWQRTGNWLVLEAGSKIQNYFVHCAPAHLLKCTSQMGIFVNVSFLTSLMILIASAPTQEFQIKDDPNPTTVSQTREYNAIYIILHRLLMRKLTLQIC